MIPIFKNGSSTKCENYRAICLSSVVFKLYTRIVESRLRREVEGKLEEEQAAFRPLRQTQDHICTLKTMIGKANSIGKDVTFLVLKSAFDRVPKKKYGNHYII